MCKIIIIAVCLLGSYFLPASELFKTISVNEAQEISASLDRNIFVYYYEDDCAFCSKADDSLFTDQIVRQLLADHYVSVKANYRNKIYDSWYAKYGVTCLPTMQIIDPAGNILVDIKGITSTESLIEFLSNHSEVAVQVASAEIVEPTIYEVDEVPKAEPSISSNFYTIQLGAFRNYHNVLNYQKQMNTVLGSDLSIYENQNDGLFRLFFGEFDQKSEALNALDEIEAMKIEFWVRDVEPQPSFYEISVNQ